jgi:hypothetical protein
MIKADKPVKSIKGYIVLKSTINDQSSGFKNLGLRFKGLLSALNFITPVNAAEIEERLVLLEFEYTDPDGDGIYTADIQAPAVEGEYEIITVIDHEDPELGAKEIRMITVIDPEGYIYEKVGDQELRIAEASIFAYWLNPQTKAYELWPAKRYQQENPQVTNKTGKYSFLVPEGIYYLEVQADGYKTYIGNPFEVRKGNGIHFNIELKHKYSLLKNIDWQTILVLLLAVLLLYNFYRDKKRDKILEPPQKTISFTAKKINKQNIELLSIKAMPAVKKKSKIKKLFFPEKDHVPPLKKNKSKEPVECPPQEEPIPKKTNRTIWFRNK